MRRGWYNESYRHSLARHGIKTARFSKATSYTPGLDVIKERNKQVREPMSDMEVEIKRRILQGKEPVKKDPSPINKEHAAAFATTLKRLLEDLEDSEGKDDYDKKLGEFQLTLSRYGGVLQAGTNDVKEFAEQIPRKLEDSIERHSRATDSENRVSVERVKEKELNVDDPRVQFFQQEIAKLESMPQTEERDLAIQMAKRRMVETPGALVEKKKKEINLDRMFRKMEKEGYEEE